MEFLNKYFDNDTIMYLNDNVPKVILEELEKEQKLVSKNISFLKDLGVSNIDNIFKNYYDMFLMDPELFSEIFNKYDKEDLIEKLKKNLTIIEHL
ncbi:MAG: hypothetical protein SOZ04_04455 [Bacilli bacterium]|nr:hypothetical protein [Bacilli bacterium]